MSRGKAPNLCDMRVKKECVSRNKTKQNKKWVAKQEEELDPIFQEREGSCQVSVQVDPR